MTHTPTQEQAAIVTAAQNQTNNLLVSALAGAAKTSTLVLIAEALPEKSILCLAFNKKIATEMSERLPSNCTALTLHSMGYRSWREIASGRMSVDNFKMYKLIDAWIDDECDQEEAEELRDSMGDIKRAIGYAKSAGYIPDKFTNPAFKRLMNDDQFLALSEVNYTDLEWTLIQDVLCTSITRGLLGHIDFNDMVYLPTLHRSCTFEKPSVLLVDEAQDLSSLNHAMVKKVAGMRTRVIAVGDACQSIYGFRGANQDSMELMKEQFDMEELHLTISFRCPKTVVMAARWRAPAMRYPEWAIDGQVSIADKWSADIIKNGSAILCRNNAPLFRCAIRLLRAGRYPELMNGDVVKRIDKIFSSFGADDMPVEEVQLCIKLWEEKELKRKKSAGATADIVAALEVFVEDSATLLDCRNKLAQIANTSGSIKLMTVHKSKGLEYPDIYLLDRDLIQHKEEKQEANLLYVAQTRAQQSLTYIYSEDWIG